MTRIKMCGLSRMMDIEAANEIGPELIGFVFWEKSRRFVSDENALRLKQRLKPDIAAVGVFLDDDMDHIISLCERGIIDMIQLHGHEDEAYISALRSRTNKPIIKAFVIHDREDLKAANDSIADYILLDSGTGSGEPFDWRVLENTDRPYFLAGGLTPENVAEAVKLLRPYAVDVSSGIETDGKKDPVLMREFIKNARNQ